MIIVKNKKYLATIGIKHFLEKDESLNPYIDVDTEFFILPNAEVEVDYVFENKAKVFVVLSGEIEDEYGNKCKRIISLEAFLSCFKEV